MLSCHSPQVSGKIGDAVNHLRILFLCTPHAVEKKGGREDKTRGSYKPLPHPQVSPAQPDRSHKDFFSANG